MRCMQNVSSTGCLAVGHSFKVLHEAQTPSVSERSDHQPVSKPLKDCCEHLAPADIQAAKRVMWNVKEVQLANAARLRRIAALRLSSFFVLALFLWCRCSSVVFGKGPVHVRSAGIAVHARTCYG